MDTNRPQVGTPQVGTPHVAGHHAGRTRTWAGVAFIAVLPLVLGVVGYFRPVLRGGTVSRMWFDVPFAAYQLSHASELGGRWWTIADDDRLGAPYQTEAAKNPSLYEGLDVMTLATVAARLRPLSPARHYDLAVLAVLAANGWVAGWLVRRQTNSWFWAALAVSLITLNHPTEWRIISGHNHIFKYGWALLAVASFSAYLRSPGWRRGVVLGLAVAWQLQGSFYQGFLLGLGLAAWWAGCAVGGRVGRRHVVGAVTAGLTFGLAAAAFVWPVATVAKGAALSDVFFRRTQKDVWAFGSELWQYVVPPDSESAARYVNGVGHKLMPYHFEGWAFPGYTVLLAVGLYLGARSRGWRPAVSDPRALDLWVGLAGVFVVLSLSGGPSFYLFEVFPTFRCYGRAALLAMALGCVAAPVIAHALIGSLRSRGMRAAATAAVVALAAYDGYRAVKTVPDGGPGAIESPAWSTWLKGQPAGVKLAAFAPLADPANSYYSWGSEGFRERPGRGHAILNGAEFHLLRGDLALLGATYDRMNPAALRFVVSLGYDALAFDAAYLDRNPWLRSAPGLRLVEARDGWSIYRAGAELGRYPATTRGRLLAARSSPTEVPPGCWITGGLGVKDDVVVAGAGQAFVTWVAADGRAHGAPRRALIQHVFGKDIPAFSVLTPGKPGAYRLVFLDDRGHRLGEKPYVVDAALRPLAATVAGETYDVSVRPLAGPPAPGRARFAVENHTPYFLQAQAGHWFLPPSVRLHPGFDVTWPGSLSLDVGPRRAGPAKEPLLLLPHDLAPGNRMVLDLPADFFNAPVSEVLTALSPLIRSENEPSGRAMIGSRPAPVGRLRR